jgi:hypothetical protein
MTVAIIYLLNKLRYELLMSQHFFYMIKKYQEKMQSRYQRKDAAGSSKEDSENKDSKSDEKLKDLYKKTGDNAGVEAGKNEANSSKAAAFPNNQQILRNIDPFERKRRSAMMSQGSGSEEITSRKVTSRREENEIKREARKEITPGSYMDMSRQSYYEEYERPKGSFYTQAVNDKLVQGESNNLDDPTRFKMNKQRQFLRGLRFNFIKDSYNRSLGNQSSQRKIQFAMYAVPAVVSFGLALSNYFQQSFGIYLKY